MLKNNNKKHNLSFTNKKAHKRHKRQTNKFLIFTAMLITSIVLIGFIKPSMQANTLVEAFDDTSQTKQTVTTKITETNKTQDDIKVYEAQNKPMNPSNTSNTDNIDNINSEDSWKLVLVNQDNLIRSDTHTRDFSRELVSQIVSA